ncbi:DUF6875 domain-containing protein [Gloeocapsopsis sp. IPPAS B-1203]|uniref:DUF6875 domain-containing protein n=1 Tax=Gloeocapsopsis sp. IPPAS B-1203 TaxID=2049454 RepID=UPI000C176383|nr:hypothetical protein [Gloeocapsopsis sp. IPPAS B-1203]PIG94239.1 hypothetical protein CSQ79_07910 [Gloeocapsopsis sp. IPPAS B-1203]
MQLYSPIELDQIQEDIPYLSQTMEWVKMFLAKPHPDLGRAGPVCPFLPRALQLNSIRLTVIRTQNLEQQQVEKIVKGYQNIFFNLEPTEGEAAFYKALMLIFPDISTEAFKLIDSIQRQLKPSFVEAGLMIGEFHKQNSSSGLHNPNFRPLRSPIPMLGIRFMVESDLPFLNDLNSEPSLRIRYLEAYLSRLHNVLKDEKVKLAQEALSLAKYQLEQFSLVN